MIQKPVLKTLTFHQEDSARIQIRKLLKEGKAKQEIQAILYEQIKNTDQNEARIKETTIDAWLKQEWQAWEEQVSENKVTDEVTTKTLGRAAVGALAGSIMGSLAPFIIDSELFLSAYRIKNIFTFAGAAIISFFWVKVLSEKPFPHWTTMTAWIISTAVGFLLGLLLESIF